LRTLARFGRPGERTGDQASRKRRFAGNRGRLPDSPLVQPIEVSSPFVVPVSG
jgi:hypothetical protein